MTSVSASDLASTGDDDERDANDGENEGEDEDEDQGEDALVWRAVGFDVVVREANEVSTSGLFSEVGSSNGLRKRARACASMSRNDGGNTCTREIVAESARWPSAMGSDGNKEDGCEEQALREAGSSCSCGAHTARKSSSVPRRLTTARAAWRGPSFAAREALTPSPKPDKASASSDVDELGSVFRYREERFSIRCGWDGRGACGDCRA